MADYRTATKETLIEQFKGKRNIEILMEVIGEELQEVFDFFEELRTQRDLYHAEGKQLDRVGEIVVMTRKEAGQLTGNPIPIDVIPDDTYRLYLIYKILKNTNNCTYPEIMKAFRMFWDRPLYYREDPEQPATMIFDTGEMQGLVDTSPLFAVPFIRAAGVTTKLYARTSTEMPPSVLKIRSGFLRVTEDHLPWLERNIDYAASVQVYGGLMSVSQDQLPGVERDWKFGGELHSGGVGHSIMQTPIGNVEYRA